MRVSGAASLSPLCRPLPREGPGRSDVEEPLPQNHRCHETWPRPVWAGIPTSAFGLLLSRCSCGGQAPSLPPVPGQPLGPRLPCPARSGGGRAAVCTPCASLSARSGAPRPHQRSQHPPRLGHGARGYRRVRDGPAGSAEPPCPGRAHRAAEAARPRVSHSICDRAAGCRFPPCRPPALAERESKGKGKCQAPGGGAECPAPLPGFTPGSAGRAAVRERTPHPRCRRGTAGPARAGVGAVRARPAPGGGRPPARPLLNPGPRQGPLPAGTGRVRSEARRERRALPAAPGSVPARARMALGPRCSVAGPGLGRHGTVLFPPGPRLRARQEEMKAKPRSGTGLAQPQASAAGAPAGHTGEVPELPAARSGGAPGPPGPHTAGPTQRFRTLSAAAEAAPGPGGDDGAPSTGPAAEPRAPQRGAGRRRAGSAARRPESPGTQRPPRSRCRFPIPSAEKRSEIKRYGKKERHFIGDFTMLESTMKVLVHSRKVGPKMVLCHSIYRFTQTFTKSL